MCVHNAFCFSVHVVYVCLLWGWYTCVHVCTHSCVGLSSSVFLYCSPFYFWTPLSNSADSWGSLYLLVFHIDTKDSNAGLHADLESTVLTQPSPSHTHFVHMCLCTVCLPGPSRHTVRIVIVCVRSPYPAWWQQCPAVPLDAPPFLQTPTEQQRIGGAWTIASTFLEPPGRGVIT